MDFSKELSVGNRTLDSEHRKLHSIINEINRLIVEKNVAALLAAFEVLENNLRLYFSVKEDFAQAVNVDLTQHKQAHQNLLNKFRHIKDELIEQNGAWPKVAEKRYLDSLRYGLFQHIKEDCKMLKILLETNFYDFKPNEMDNMEARH